MCVHVCLELGKLVLVSLVHAGCDSGEIRTVALQAGHLSSVCDSDWLMAWRQYRTTDQVLTAQLVQARFFHWGASYWIIDSYQTKHNFLGRGFTQVCGCVCWVNSCVDKALTARPVFCVLEDWDFRTIPAEHRILLQIRHREGWTGNLDYHLLFYITNNLQLYVAWLWVIYFNVNIISWKSSRVFSLHCSFKPYCITLII